MTSVPIPARAQRRNRRAVVATALVVVALAVISAGLDGVRGVGLDTVLLVFLLVSVAGAAAGGAVPAVVGVVCSAAAANWFFVDPRHSLRIRSSTEAVDLAAFVLVTTLVTVLAEMRARARASAERERVVAAWSTGVDQAADPISPGRLMAQARDLFRLDRLVLSDAGRDVLTDEAPDADPSQPVSVLGVDAGDGLTLRVYGPDRIGLDRDLLGSVALTVGRLYRTEQLRATASRVEELAQIDRTRSALLAAVSHDLRTPLAGIKACVGTLREDDIELDDADRSELLAEVEDQADRLGRLIGNLLAMSRVQAGALTVATEPTSVTAVVGLAVPQDARVEVRLPEDLPLVVADSGLLERVIANVVENAAKYGGTRPIEITAGRRPGWVDIEVIDHGPGVDLARREQMFEPFQRLDDRSTTGTGLGLAIARGFVEAMDGRLVPGDTPGGGLTMTISLPVWDGEEDA